MSYLKFPVPGASVVEAVLEGVESDVFLVDGANLSSFERGTQFRYTGGHYQRSPVRLAVPSGSGWTVVVIPGAGGTVRASVRVLAVT
jgi:Domain of unknown function (DUF1883)